MRRDKALIELDGATLLQRAVEHLRAVADPIVLASGSRELGHPGCLTVADDVAGRGPLAGLLAALRASPHQLCAVVAVDMPDIEPELLRHMAVLRQAGDDAVVPVSPRGIEPLHAVYARACSGAVEDALRSRDRSLRGLIGRLRVRTVDAAEVIGPVAASRFARNLNSPAEVTAWRRARAERPHPPPP